MSILATILILATASAPAAPELITGPIKMTQSEIRAYNARLSSDHPNYIRCVRSAALGSLVSRNLSCSCNMRVTKKKFGKISLRPQKD